MAKVSTFQDGSIWNKKTVTVNEMVKILFHSMFFRRKGRSKIF